MGFCETDCYLTGSILRRVINCFVLALSEASIVDWPFKTQYVWYNDRIPTSKVTKKHAIRSTPTNIYSSMPGLAPSYNIFISLSSAAQENCKLPS